MRVSASLEGDGNVGVPVIVLELFGSTKESGEVLLSGALEIRAGTAE